MKRTCGWVVLDKRKRANNGSVDWKNRCKNGGKKENKPYYGINLIRQVDASLLLFDMISLINHFGIPNNRLIEK